MRSRQRGFTLLEVLIATAIAGISVTGLMSAISSTAHNANRLTAKDRAAFLAKSRMDEPERPVEMLLQHLKVYA